MATPPICPVCGEPVPPRSKACPECGADERTGWNEESRIYDGLDLPDDAWEEHPAQKRRTAPEGMPSFWKIAALILLLALILLWARR